MRGGLLCQAGRSNDLHKATALIEAPQGTGEVSEAWDCPISIWALKGATKYKHDIVKSLDAEFALFEARFGSSRFPPVPTPPPSPPPPPPPHKKKNQPK